MAPEAVRLSPRQSHGRGGRPQPSVPIQLRAGRVLGLLLVEVPLLLIPRHDVQVVKVGVVIHGAAGGGGCQGPALWARPQPRCFSPFREELRPPGSKATRRRL